MKNKEVTITTKIQLVARQDIAPSPLHGYYRNDTELYALDGIRFGKVVEIDDNENPVDMLPQLIDAFKADNPGWLVSRYSIRREDGTEI